MIRDMLEALALLTLGIALLADAWRTPAEPELAYYPKFGQIGEQPLDRVIAEIRRIFGERPLDVTSESPSIRVLYVPAPQQRLLTEALFEALARVPEADDVEVTRRDARGALGGDAWVLTRLEAADRRALAELAQHMAAKKSDFDHVDLVDGIFVVHLGGCVAGDDAGSVPETWHGREVRVRRSGFVPAPRAAPLQYGR